MKDDDACRDLLNRAIASVEAHVGIPLTDPDGRVFGSICGVSSEPSADPEAMRRQQPLLNLLGTLLSTVLAADLQRTQAERLAEWSGRQAETDVLAWLGGDELGVVDTRTDPAEADALVERLQSALEAAGVATSSGQAPHTVAGRLEGAWRTADDAMYASKAGRRLSSVS